MGLEPLREHLGGHPGVDVDEVRALHGLLVGADDLHAAAARRGGLVRLGLDAHVGLEAFGAGDDHLEAELAGHQHGGVGQAGGRVRGAVAPAERDLRLRERPLLLLHRHDVGEGLAGVLHRAGGVDQGDRGQVGRLLQRGAGDGAVGDGVHVPVDGHDGVVPVLFGRQADPHAVLAEVDHVAAELRHGGLEGDARAGRGRLEDARQRLALQQPVGPADLLLELQQLRHLEDALDLLFRDVGDALQVASFQVAHAFLPFPFAGRRLRAGFAPASRLSASLPFSRVSSPSRHFFAGLPPPRSCRRAGSASRSPSTSAGRCPSTPRSGRWPGSPSAAAPRTA